VQVVREYLGRQATLVQLSRRHELSGSLIRISVGKYQRGELLAGSSGSTREKQLETRVAELELKIGQLAMENDLLKKTEEHMRRRRLLEVNELAPQILGRVNAYLARKGLLLKRGTRVDVALT